MLSAEASRFVLRIYHLLGASVRWPEPAASGMAFTSVCQKHGDGFMSPAELIAVFRLYADRCVEIAQELPDVAHRVALLNIARTWFTAADRLEQNGVILGVSLRVSQLDKSQSGG
jgi:hypothetical protein